jgi:hypothetical protein
MNLRLQRTAFWAGLPLFTSTPAWSGEANVASHRSPAQPIRDGFTVEPCGWPSTITLITPNNGTTERCTGVYIGGRVVVTAAHCIPGGYFVPTNCMEDADCPQVDAFGLPQPLECSLGQCESSDPNRSNTVKEVLFGESYPAYLTDGHIRKSIPVHYCERRVTGEDINDPEDFAYCLLVQRPNLRPVPVMMDCEADQFLQQGEDVVAVGFGRSVAADVNSGGTKRFASSTLTSSSTANATTMSSFSDWTNAGGTTPSGPLSGDSGGPLMLQLPDGTWRVVGLAVTDLPEYTTIWHNIRWMFTTANDSNLINDLAEVLPCHTPDGDWSPTAACTGFPMSPDMGAGDWARGPRVCDSTDIGDFSATCGAPFALALVPPRPSHDPSFNFSRGQGNTAVAPESIRAILFTGGLCAILLGAFWLRRRTYG